jgi:hypothetical protein
MVRDRCPCRAIFVRLTTSSARVLGECLGASFRCCRNKLMLPDAPSYHNRAASVVYEGKLSNSLPVFIATADT